MGEAWSTAGILECGGKTKEFFVSAQRSVTNLGFVCGLMMVGWGLCDYMANATIWITPAGGTRLKRTVSEAIFQSDNAWPHIICITQF